MSSTFVSKSRRVRFELTLRIIDLNNVPLVSGTSFVKWHLPSSTAAEHRGKTSKCAIIDHRVQYHYEKTTQVRLVVGKDQMLQECSVHFEVQQEYSAGGRGERITLGRIHLNLAEYAGAEESRTSSGGGGEAGEGGGGGGSSTNDRKDSGITRRYLMQDSKINSTLKIGITLRHLEGSREYWAPPLKTAAVFGGIAGIISSSDPTASATYGVASSFSREHTDGRQEVPIPTLTSTNKEAGEMQDIYRRALAAFWSSQPGELKADECIEDIFAGGDGWGKNSLSRRSVEQSGQTGLSATTSTIPGNRVTPFSATPLVLDADGGTILREGMRDGQSTMSAPDLAGTNPRHHFPRHFKNKASQSSCGELDELDVRDDLVTWQIKRG